MKIILLSLLVTLRTLLSRTCTPLSPTTAYFYTGRSQLFTIPSNVETLEIYIAGASGGNIFNINEFSDERGSGGLGMDIHMNLSVTRDMEHEKLYIVVGGQGSYCHENEGSIGGYNGGGKGAVCTDCMKSYDSCYANAGAGGGGSSDIRLFEKAIQSRIIVAAGGGWWILVINL